jgi:hypothetical protein
MRAIESKVWRNYITGQTASVCGAVPYHNAAECAEWQIVTRGWTIEHDDGTRGIGRVPFETREAAEAWIAAHPKFRGMSQD